MLNKLKVAALAAMFSFTGALAHAEVNLSAHTTAQGTAEKLTVSTLGEYWL